MRRKGSSTAWDDLARRPGTARWVTSGPYPWRGIWGHGPGVIIRRVQSYRGRARGGLPRPRTRWSHGVRVQDRGPGEAYRPDDVPPSVFAFHQPGVATPVLDHLAFAALGVTAATQSDLRDLLAALTREAERLMRAAHQSDGTRPAGKLAATLGLGPGMFGERFGLGARRPVALADPPAFRRDALDPATSGGDLCLQVCADAPAKADSALATLLASPRDMARRRWCQRASMHRRPGDRPDGRPRNLLGFKDATANPPRGQGSRPSRLVRTRRALLDARRYVSRRASCPGPARCLERAHARTTRASHRPPP